MGDAERNVILVDLDKPRRLVLDLNALIELADLFGTDPDNVGQMLVKDGRPDLRAVRKFLWVGLKQEEPNLAEEDVGRLAGIMDLGEIGRKFNAFFSILAGREPEIAAVMQTTKPNRQARRHSMPS